jgi:hypothetical protein
MPGTGHEFIEEDHMPRTQPPRNPAANPSPPAGQSAYAPDAPVARDPDGSQVKAVAAAQKSRRTPTGPTRHNAGVRATDLASPDRRGQSRHPTSGRFQ